ncbi:MAG: pyridoxamine 5'-phosphate oxidase family protein, partial [Thermoanaerobaculia bacterium]
MHHSMNYRSVVVLGRGRAITGREEKLAAMHAIVEHVAPGRWNESREPSESELAATAVVAVEIREASAKRRSGPPVDAEADYVLPHWAGVIPMQMMMGEPRPDPRLEGELPLPPSVEAMVEMQELGESSVSGRDGV